MKIGVVASGGYLCINDGEEVCNKCGIISRNSLPRIANLD